MVSVPPAEFVAGAVAAGVPAEEAEALADLFVKVLDGRNASVSGDVERVLGRPATDFAAFARRAAATGVSGPDPARGSGRRMNAGLASVSITAAALGSGVVGGVLYGFSAFVMRGLDATRPGTAVAAMQEINRAAPRAPLTVPLLGTALLCVLLAVRATRDLRGDDGSTAPWWVLAGCALYLVAFLITAAYHVPRNTPSCRSTRPAPTRLPRGATTPVTWVRMNHVRAIAAIASSASFMVALLH